MDFLFYFNLLSSFTSILIFFIFFLILFLWIIKPFIIKLANKNKNYKKKKIFIIYEQSINTLFYIMTVLILINIILFPSNIIAIARADDIFYHDTFFDDDIDVYIWYINIITLIIGAVGIAIIYRICYILKKNNIAIFKPNIFKPNIINEIKTICNDMEQILEVILGIIVPIAIPICILIFIFNKMNNSIYLQSFLVKIINNINSEYMPILLAIAIILAAIFCLFFILIFIVIMINSMIAIINQKLNKINKNIENNKSASSSKLETTKKDNKDNKDNDYII